MTSTKNPINFTRGSVKLSYSIPCVLVFLVITAINHLLTQKATGDYVIIYEIITGVFLALVFGLLFDYFVKDKDADFDDDLGKYTKGDKKKK